MFSASKLTKDSMDFINYLIGSNIGKCPVTTVAIAYAIGKQLQLPSSKVENIEGYFKQTHYITVMKKISQLNEFVIVNPNDIADTVRKFFLVRYYVVNPPDLCWCPNPDTAIIDLLGINLGLDENTINVIKSEPTKLSKIHNSAIKFFTEMASTE